LIELKLSWTLEQFYVRFHDWIHITCVNLQRIFEIANVRRKFSWKRVSFRVD